MALPFVDVSLPDRASRHGPRFLETVLRILHTRAKFRIDFARREIIHVVCSSCWLLEEIHVTNPRPHMRSEDYSSRVSASVCLLP